MSRDPQIHPHPGELVYSSSSPEDTAKTSGRSCGISLFWNQDRKVWTLAFRYTKSDWFTTPEETDILDTIEVDTLWGATSSVFKYDMPAHFLIDFSVVTHCALIDTIVRIHDWLSAAWANETAKFTAAVAENQWEWDETRKM